jgi:hypothetical protein
MLLKKGSIIMIKEIDIVAIDPATDEVNLIIMDEHHWDDLRVQIDYLQNKLSTYINLIESGELKKHYPSLNLSGLIIHVVFDKDTDEEALEFIEKAKSCLDDTGYRLKITKF